MTIYPIPDTLAEKYHGAGHALASITGGQIVNLIYLRDIIDNFDAEDTAALPKILDDPRLGPAVRMLQATGQVSIGMCSCYEFVVS